MYQNKFCSRDDIYFLNHSVGCLPADTQQTVEQKFFQPWQDSIESPWGNWLNGIDEFCQELSKLMNSEVTSFCPQMNVSHSLTKLLFSLPEENHKKTILLTEHDFPSMVYVVRKFCEQKGYSVRFIPKTENVADLNIWDEYLTDDVYAVLITHVYSNLGNQAPVSEIIRLCRQRETLSIIDVAQSAGILPIDLSSWNADFVIGSCVKWLCGGPGAGYLWVHPDRIQQCQPVDVGWFSHAEPLEFNVHDFRYHETALRFWGGTPSVVPYIIAANSIKLLASIGIENIRQHNLLLTQRIIDVLDAGNLVSPAEQEFRSGTLVIDFAERQQQVIEYLQQAQVRFDSRVTGLRLSPHIYNTKEEVDQLIKLLM